MKDNKRMIDLKYIVRHCEGDSPKQSRISLSFGEGWGEVSGLLRHVRNDVLRKNISPLLLPAEMKIRILALIIAASTLWSCNPKMEIPSYIWIDSVDFQVLEPALQGTASHKISDVKIVANGQSLGFYQLPARIPILEHGNTRLSINAGIMINGIPQLKAEYPFYTPYILNVDLKKGEIDTILPHFTYTDNTEFYHIENFESAGMQYAAYGTSAPLNKTNDKTLIFHQNKEDNKYSGIVELPYTNDSATVYHFEFRTIKPVELNSSKIYDCLLEIDFRITHNVEIGMIVHSALPNTADRQVALANLWGHDNINAADNVWRKVYVNFTQSIGEANQMKNFDVYIRATISSNEKARFLFDNIKLIYH